MVPKTLTLDANSNNNGIIFQRWKNSDMSLILVVVEEGDDFRYDCDSDYPKVISTNEYKSCG